MIIKNVYLVLFYFFWFYLLVYILIQQIHDHHKIKKVDRLKAYIDVCFQPHANKRMNKRKLLRYSKHNMVLSYMEACYLKHLDEYQEKEKMKVKLLLIHAVERRIQHVKEKDVLHIIFLIQMIERCELMSRHIHHFLIQCPYQNEMQIYWLKKADRMVVSKYE